MLEVLHKCVLCASKSDVVTTADTLTSAPAAQHPAAPAGAPQAVD